MCSASLTVFLESRSTAYKVSEQRQVALELRNLRLEGLHLVPGSNRTTPPGRGVRGLRRNRQRVDDCVVGGVGGFSGETVRGRRKQEPRERVLVRRGDNTVRVHNVFGCETYDRRRASNLSRPAFVPLQSYCKLIDILVSKCEFSNAENRHFPILVCKC